MTLPPAPIHLVLFFLITACSRTTVPPAPFSEPEPVAPSVAPPVVETPPEPEPAGEEVHIAARDLVPGHVIADGDVKVERREFVPEGQGLEGSPVGRTLRETVVAGEMLLSARLADPKGGSGIHAIVPRGMAAGQIIARASGAIRAGDYLAIASEDRLLQGVSVLVVEPEGVLVAANPAWLPLEGQWTVALMPPTMVSAVTSRPGNGSVRPGAATRVLHPGVPIGPGDVSGDPGALQGRIPSDRILEGQVPPEAKLADAAAARCAQCFVGVHAAGMLLVGVPLESTSELRAGDPIDLMKGGRAVLRNRMLVTSTPGEVWFTGTADDLKMLSKTPPDAIARHGGDPDPALEPLRRALAPAPE
jgi:hypothetical protein